MMQKASLLAEQLAASDIARKGSGGHRGHTAEPEWTDAIDKKFRVPASELELPGGGTLCEGAAAVSGAGLGAGAFGKVDSYIRHGARVAVKVLKNRDEIGMRKCAKLEGLLTCLVHLSCAGLAPCDRPRSGHLHGS